MDDVKKVARFIRHVDDSIETMLDSLDTTGYEDRYNLQLIMNDSLLTLGMNADTYCRLETFLLEEAKEFLENDTDWLERIRPLAAWQAFNTSPADITFNHIKTPIRDPFVDVTRHEVNPVEAYGKWFLLSDWMNEDKVKALEDYINENG